MARVTRSKHKALEVLPTVDEEDSTLRGWRAAPPPPVRPKKRSKRSQPDTGPSTSAGPCWLELDAGLLERVFELLLADPGGGKEACKAAGAACKVWREACMEVVLGDTAASRPARPMPEDLTTSCAAVWDGPKSEAEGFEACSQRRKAQAQARALLTTSTGRRAPKPQSTAAAAARVRENAAAAAAAAAARAREQAAAAARAREAAAAAAAEAALQRQLDFAALVLPQLPPLQALARLRGGPSGAAATGNAAATRALRAGSARAAPRQSTEECVTEAAAAWVSPRPRIPRVTRGQQHKQQQEQQQARDQQAPSASDADENGAAAVEAPMQQRGSAQLRCQRDHGAAQRTASPLQQEEQRQWRRRRQQQQQQEEEPTATAKQPKRRCMAPAAATAPQHQQQAQDTEEGPHGRSPSTHADSRSLPPKRQRAGRRTMRTRSQPGSPKQTQSCSREPSPPAQGRRGRQEEQEVQQVKAGSAAGASGVKAGGGAGGVRKCGAVKRRQQRREQAQPPQQQEMEAEDVVQPARLGWDSMPGATLLRGIFSRFAPRG